MRELPVERHRLGNGLRVVLSPDPSIPVVAVNLWYGVGSRNERPGRTGFAHLFEHMMFQGSAHAPKNRHFELIERAGGSLNATTWFDRTNYFETVPSHALDLALWLESDRMGWMVPALTAETLRNQIEVVSNERRQRYDNQPWGDWDERLQRLAWPGDHPYHHTVIGSLEDIAAATLEDVEDFSRTYYVPRNAVLTLAGDLPPDALDRVDRWFGEIPGGDPPPPIPGRTTLPPTLGGTLREEVEADVPLPRVYMALRIPPLTDDRFPVADVAGDILGGGRASRLYRALVRDARIARDASAYVFPLTTGASMAVVWATGLPGTGVDALEEALSRELERMVEVEPTELARALARAETGILARAEQAGARADGLSMHEMLFGDARTFAEELDRLRTVDLERIRSLAGATFGSDNRAIVRYLPRGSA